MYASVALKFDDHNVVYRSRFPRFMVKEANAKVDCQSLRLGVVYKGNAVERIFHCGDNVTEGVTRSLSEEFLAVFVVDDGLNRWDFNALFAGFSVIVLLLNLKEAVPRVKVGSGSHFCARKVPTMVLAKHFVCHGSVPIDGAIVGDALPIVMLRRIGPNGQLQKLFQFRKIRNKLRVRALHEAYGLHFFQRNGMHLRYKLVKFVVESSH